MKHGREQPRPATRAAADAVAHATSDRDRARPPAGDEGEAGDDARPLGRSLTTSTRRSAPQNLSSGASTEDKNRAIAPWQRAEFSCSTTQKVSLSGCLALLSALLKRTSKSRATPLKSDEWISRGEIMGFIAHEHQKQAQIKKG